MDDRVLQLVIDHRVAAVLDDNGLTVIFLDIRKSLNQNVGSQLRIHIVCFLFCDGSIHAFSFLFGYVFIRCVLTQSTLYPLRKKNHVCIHAARSVPSRKRTASHICATRFDS